ncbi:hypothetical protein ABJI51_41200 [Amycolatopsis sp. NEAU-NG30]|uniref:Uncharacterized protein n=1 Tax=Amycolatopsis melonis TaxID=3156488 RepID=A0ABV0LTB1_9PSEU
MRRRAGGRPEFRGLSAEKGIGERIGEQARLRVDEQMGRLRGGALAGKSAAVIPPRYRFDSEHITKTNIRHGGEHFGPVAVTLDAGDLLARAAIVDA